MRKITNRRRKIVGSMKKEIIKKRINIMLKKIKKLARINLLVDNVMEQV